MDWEEDRMGYINEDLWGDEPDTVFGVVASGGTITSQKEKELMRKYKGDILTPAEI